MHKTKNFIIDIVKLALVAIILAITIRVFRPQFYHRNNSLHMAIEIIAASVFTMCGYYLIKYLISNFIKGDWVQENKEMISAIAAFSMIAVIECRPSATEYQYYVNIYDDSGNQYTTGYVDVIADDIIPDENAFDEIYISRLYFDKTHNYKVIECDNVELNFDNTKYYILLENDDEYYVEFMKRKDN